MSFFYPMSDFSDFTQTVTVARPSSGLSKVVTRATQLHPGKSETGFFTSKLIPHVKTIWFIPKSVGFELRRGDRVIDREGRNWIIVEPIPYDRFDTYRCRCVHETLTPGADDYIDLFRLESFGGAGEEAVTVAANIPAIVRSRNQTVERESDRPVKKLRDEIIFLVQSEIDLIRADILRRKGDRTLYEIISYETPPLHSDWGIITARRILGDHGDWHFPKDI